MLLPQYATLRRSGFRLFRRRQAWPSAAPSSTFRARAMRWVRHLHQDRLDHRPAGDDRAQTELSQALNCYGNAVFAVDWSEPEAATLAVIETPDYLSDARAAGMTNIEREAVIMMLATKSRRRRGSPRPLAERGKSASRDGARERVAAIG